MKDSLKEYVYDVVGYLFKIYKELPCGYPEYIYQEVLGAVLSENGVVYKKEYVHHPVINGKTLSAFLKMDFMLERSRGNIIIECKALEGVAEIVLQPSIGMTFINELDNFDCSRTV